MDLKSELRGFDDEELDWRECLSIEYGNHLITYRQAARQYKQRRAFEVITEVLPVVAMVGVTAEIIGILQESMKQ